MTVLCFALFAQPIIADPRFEGDVQHACKQLEPCSSCRLAEEAKVSAYAFVNNLVISPEPMLTGPYALCEKSLHTGVR